LARRSQSSTSGSTYSGTQLPAGFWGWALKTAPKPARFLLGGYLLLAVGSSLLAWHVSLRALVATVILVLFCSGAVVSLANVARRQRSVAGALLNWALIILLILTLLLFTLSAFFGIPERGGLLVANLLDMQELVLSQGSDSKTITSSFWPAEATDVLDVHGTRIDRINALAKRPSLTVTPEHPLGGGTVYVNVLTIQGEGIVTRGLPLHLEANKILSSEGVIRSSAIPPAKASQGVGQKAGDVTLIVQDRIVGALAVDLSGQAGADGVAGNPGAQGAPGTPGEDAASHLADCAHGAGAGGRGNAGARGSPGNHGQPGGDGGILRLASAHPEVLARVVRATVSAGSGGAGGAGGPGGPGGVGGPGGSPRPPWCQGGGAQGPSGPAGDTGWPGVAGSSGKEGEVRLLTVDAAGEMP
jgi:hypothetical protein